MVRSNLIIRAARHIVAWIALLVPALHSRLPGIQVLHPHLPAPSSPVFAPHRTMHPYNPLPLSLADLHLLTPFASEQYRVPYRLSRTNPQLRNTATSDTQSASVHHAVAHV